MGSKAEIRNVFVKLPVEEHRALKREALDRGMLLRDLVRERLTQPKNDAAPEGNPPRAA
jgi:hypothetical protein